jgi:hypothetical protein
MKHFWIFVAAMSSLMAFEGCSEGVMNEGTMAMTPEGQLRVGTRDDDANSVKDGRIYVMDATGSCVSVLSVSASQPQVTKGLPKGTYDLYALGGDDLTCLTLPEANAAKGSSLIREAANKTMGDLLWGHKQVTLARGDVKDLNIEMARKVVCITGISIEEIPAEVSAVNVSLMPMYEALTLNGDYGANIHTVNIALTKHDVVWESTEPVYCFPSNGRATITISLTTSEGQRHYSYVTEAEGLPVNTQVTINATYSEAWATTINATLSYTAWGTPKTFTFEFNEGHAGNKRNDGETTVPTVGQIYDGYYVVSVDATNKKAVVLRRKQEAGYDTKEKLEEKLGKIDKPSHAAGEWRLPTLAECAVFALDATLPFREFDHGYYFQEGDDVKSYDITVENGFLKHTGITEGYSAETWFRPVIDVTY